MIIYNALAMSVVADIILNLYTLLHGAKVHARPWSNSQDAESTTGKWSKEEEACFAQILRDLGEEGLMPQKSPMFWKEVSRQMDNTQTAKQCSNKWCVQPRFLAHFWFITIGRNLGKALRWRDADTRRLVQK